MSDPQLAPDDQSPVTSRSPRCITFDLPPKDKGSTSSGVDSSGLSMSPPLEGLVNYRDWMQVAVRGEKLYVTKDKRQSQSWRRCICWGCGFVLLSVAILIAVLAGTGVILSQESQTLVTEKTETSHQLGSGSDDPWTGASLDKAGGKSEPPPSEASSFTPPPSIQTGVPPMPTTDMSLLYVPRALDSELVIDNVEFNPQLSVAGSEEFQNLANSLEEELRSALFDVQTLSYGAADIFVKVVGFSPGSVVVKFRIGWVFKEGIRKAPDPIDKDAVRQRLERQLNLNGGVLGSYHIPKGSIRANRLLDTCQFNNGECSHDCAFDYRKKMTFVCTCPTGLHLEASGRNCTDVVPVEMEATPTHGHKPSPEPVPEPAPAPSAEPTPEPEPETEPSSTSTLSTAAASSSSDHHVGPLPVHTTAQSQPSEYSTTIPTMQPSSTDHALHFYHQEHDYHHNHGIDENVAVTTVMYPSEQETVSGPHTAQDYDLSRQTENGTLQSHTADKNNSEMTGNHSHHPEVPASVYMIYDDETNMEHSLHTPVKNEEVGSTLSPHFHTETQTFVVNVTNKHSMTEYPDDTIIRHRGNESNMMMVSEREKAAAAWLNMFTAHEMQTEAGVTTTGISATSELQEHHTATPVRIFGELTENEAKTMEKNRGFTHSILENGSKDFNSSTSKELDNADTSEISTAEPALPHQRSHTENETGTDSLKLQAADSPVRIVDAENEEHDHMFMSVHAENDTKILPDSSEKMSSVALTQPAGREMHKHGSDFFNDVYFPDSEHAENDTFLNALSPEDYENHAVKPVNVVSQPILNKTVTPKKGARLDDVELFQMNPNQRDHTSTSEPDAESVPLVIHSSESVSQSSAAPVTDSSYGHDDTAENKQIPSLSHDIINPHFIHVTEVTENGNATFGTGEAFDETTNKSGDIDGHDMLHDMLDSITEHGVMEITLKPHKQNLPEIVKGADKQVDTDSIVTESVSEGTSEDTVTAPVTSNEASLAESFESFGAELTTVMQPDHVASDITTKDFEMTSVPTLESVNTYNAVSTPSMLVNDSNSSTDSKVNSSVGGNAVENGELLHPAFFSTTTELEVDHPLTVAPLPEHHDSETMPEDKDTVVGPESSAEITTHMESVDVTTKSLLHDREGSTAAPSGFMTTQSVVHMLTVETSPTLPSESPNITTKVVPHEENDISSSADTNGHKRKTDTGIIETSRDKQEDVTKAEDRARTNTIENVTQTAETNFLTLHKDAATTTDSTDKIEKDDVNNVNVSEEVSSAFSVSSDIVGASSAAPDILGASSAAPDTVEASPAAPDTLGSSSAAPDTLGSSSVAPDTIGTSSAAPDIMINYEEVKMNKTDMKDNINSTTEAPSESDTEAQDIDQLRGNPLDKHVNTVKPLLPNASSTHNNQEPIILSLSNNTDANPNGNLDTRITDHGNSDFEKPHEFTDIENKLLVDSGKIRDVTMSSTTQDANEIHALPPSGGGNVIPPTAQSTVVSDPITDEIQNPTLLGQVKKETLPVTIPEGHSAVEHTEKSKNLTTLKVDKDVSVVSVSKPEPKKKDFLNVSINKKPLKFTGDTSSLQGENDQIFTNKSVINLYEKKPVDKLQKDSSKKIDKIGFAALPVGDNAFDEQDDLLQDTDTTTPAKEMSASTTVMVFQGANSTTEYSSLANAESRPVDEDDENEDPLTNLHKDIEHINIVEPQGTVMKDKKSDFGGNQAYKFEGEAVKNGSISAANDQHFVPKNNMETAADGVERHTESSLAVGIEPAIALGGNETSELTDSLLTSRVSPAGENIAPQITVNESVSSSAAPDDEKLMVTRSPTDEHSLNFYNENTSGKASDGNVTNNMSITGTDFLPSITSESSDIMSNIAGNISVINLSLGIMTTTMQEDSSSSASTTAPPLVLSTNITSSESPEVPANTVVTLNNKDFARLHKGSVPLKYNWTQNSTKEFNTTADASQSGSSNGVIHNGVPESNITVSSSGIFEPPTMFSKCASGQFQCVNGTSHDGAYCVSQVAKCDSVNDCSDASDEMGCVDEGCPGNFQCSSGQCLKRHLVCNGIVDCNDGSDEVNCEMWQCQFDEFQCSSGRCIPFLWHCDGKPDCDNHTDEYNCMSSCGNDEYLCPERWCIPMTWRCNGIAECANGEDEKLCDCSLDQFRCNTGGCVPLVQVCDGVEHCPDMSDEWGCVRLHNDTMELQIRSKEGTWHPVCGDGWDVSWSDVACQSLGYSKATFTEYPSVGDSVGEYYALRPGSASPLGGASSRLLSALQRSANESACTSGTVVEVACQEFTCGSHGLADGVAARLVGGDGATNGQWPSVALLYHTRYKSSCTASIISPKWLLSSYSCLHLRDKTLTAENWVAFGGGSMFETDKPETQITEVRSITAYPQVKYNQFLYNNDIALIELNQPLTFTRNVGAICLPEKEIEPRQLCVTAGWGYTSPGEINFSQYLHYLPVPTIDLRDCNSSKHYAGFITDDEICAGFTDAEKSPCYNDEGAPLMCVSEGGVWELQGVLSYHSNCGQGYHPSIFSSITAVRGWVEKTVGSRFERKSTFNIRRRRGL
uniref:Putative serine protease 69 isoform A n=1 Tax=Reticulitermes speratus TaxID=60591 RepID=A0A1V1FNG4_9NEOP